MKQIVLIVALLAAAWAVQPPALGQAVIGGKQNGLGAGGYLPHPLPPIFPRPPKCPPQMVASLTLSGFDFYIVHGPVFTNLLVDPTNPIVLPLVTTGKSGRLIPPEPIIPPLVPWLSVNATFTLANNTPSPVAFTFPWQYWADNRIVFTAYDAHDAVVWTSTPLPVDPPPLATPVTLTLNAGGKWTQTVNVPLNPSAIILPDGVYRLEATVSGTPLFSANASFEVFNLYAGPIVVDPPVTP